MKTEAVCVVLLCASACSSRSSAPANAVDAEVAADTRDAVSVVDTDFAPEDTKVVDPSYDASFKRPQDDYPLADPPKEPVGCTATLLGCEAKPATFSVPATVGTIDRTTDCKTMALHVELRDGAPYACAIGDTTTTCYGPLAFGTNYLFFLEYTSGLISASGTFSVRFGGDASAPTATFGGCFDTGSGGPRCASPDTLVATPSGERTIDSLGVGDLVYSTDERGFIVVPIVRKVRVPALAHRVVHVTFEGGGGFAMSATHPLENGRTVGDLVASEWLSGKLVRGVEAIPFEFPYTVDILPDSKTGTYVASGAVVGSTLR